MYIPGKNYYQNTSINTATNSFPNPRNITQHSSPPHAPKYKENRHQLQSIIQRKVKRSQGSRLFGNVAAVQHRLSRAVEYVRAFPCKSWKTNRCPSTWQTFPFIAQGKAPAISLGAGNAPKCIFHASHAFVKIATMRADVTMRENCDFDWRPSARRSRISQDCSKSAISEVLASRFRALYAPLLILSFPTFSTRLFSLTNRKAFCIVFFCSWIMLLLF